MKGGRAMFSSRTTRSAPASVFAILLGLLGLVAVGSSPAPSAHADHNGLYVVCPPPIPEGESDHMRIRRAGLPTEHHTCLDSLIRGPTPLEGVGFHPLNGGPYPTSIGT